MSLSDVGSDAGHGHRLRWPRAGVVASAAFFSALLVLRDPSRLLNPQFYAEDGSSFFLQAYDQGFWRALLAPTAGYLNVFPRLTAGLAMLFPLRATPLVYDLAAFAVQVTPIFYLLGGRLGRYLPDRRLRLLAATLFVAAPNSYATYVTLTNSQWNLAVVALLLVLADPPVGRTARIFEALLMAVFALTGPLGLLLLPLLVLDAVGRAPAAGRVWRATQAAILAMGGAVQVFFLLSSPRASLGVKQGAALTVREIVQILGTHVFYDSVLGIQGTIRSRAYLGLAAQVAGLALIAALALFVIVRRHHALILLLCLASATILLSFFFPVSELRAWLAPGFGPRYYYFATLFVLFGIMLMALGGGRLRGIGVLLAIPVLGVGIPLDFRHPVRPDTHWPDQVAVFASLPRGASFSIPLQPDGYGTISLQKKTAARAPSPLEGLQRLPGAPACAIDPPELVTAASWGDRLFLEVTGWATDSPDAARAEGVWVAIDDRLFPAVSGHKTPAATQELRRSLPPDAGFIRFIPLSDLGTGRHRLSLIVLARGRGGYYLIPGRDFSVTLRDSKLSIREEP